MKFRIIPPMQLRGKKTTYRVRETGTGIALHEFGGDRAELIIQAKAKMEAQEFVKGAEPDARHHSLHRA